MKIKQIKSIYMTLLITILSITIQGNTREFDQQYLKWKAEQDAKDAQLNKAQPNHYLSKPSMNPNYSGSTIKIKLNSASVSELQQLNGIGEKKAIAIIDYRQQNGGFKSIDELSNVKGIGPKLLEKNKSRLAL